ncbi:hypothetical protein FQN50_007116 [Emmonsiellopsis sp. PD_5]|nr:hypothetical protein FQN50_007116 [Emmonsiellopsis sp. PD_5]
MGAEVSLTPTPHPGTDTKSPHVTQSSPASPRPSTATSTEAPSSNSSSDIKQGALTASNLANYNRELEQTGSLRASTSLDAVQRAGESVGIAGIGLSSAQLRSQGYGLEGRMPMERYWLDDMMDILKLSMENK